MKARGIEVRLPAETLTTPVRAIHLCEVATLREKFDLVFVAVKAYDTRWVCELITPYVAENGLVVGLQNGMSQDDIVAAVAGHRAVGAVIEMASNMFEPGIVTRQTPVSGSWFAVGAVEDAARGREVEVQRVLSHAGTVAVSDDIRSAKWMKLVANAGELVPSAILDLALADAVQVPGVHEFMVECGKEAARAALADGCHWCRSSGWRRSTSPNPTSTRRICWARCSTSYSLPDTKTTVLHDWMKSRHSEYAEVNGLVVDVLERAGPTPPFNSHVVRIARAIEAGRISRGRRTRVTSCSMSPYPDLNAGAAALL